MEWCPTDNTSESCVTTTVGFLLPENPCNYSRNEDERTGDERPGNREDEQGETEDQNERGCFHDELGFIRPTVTVCGRKGT